MTVKPKYLDAVPVGRIFLALENPRHEPFDTEAQVIDYLCDKEDVYPLARDIAKHGLNPLERLALIPVNKRQSASGPINYYAAEGNRRICALKLLDDPELAPAKYRRPFAKLAETWMPIKSVQAAVFKDANDFELWLYRIHNGAQGGTGRRDWNADQKQRFSGSSKNRTALALLDYAEAEGMISPEERKGKLTTVQRFVGNDVFSEVLGLDRSNPEEIGRTRPKPEFDTLVNRFVRDLIDNKDRVNSRMNKEEIKKYARPLGSITGITTARVDTEPLAPTEITRPRRSRPKKPQRPERAKHVQYEEEIFVALRNLGNEKLSSLYHSITSIDLDPHTPLVAIGVWAFFEALTACAGRGSASFDAFLSNDRLRRFGLTGSLTSVRSALRRVHEYGNTTKHDRIAATFNGDQLNNDMATLKMVIQQLIAEAAQKS